jgi:hypothetical protein
MLLSPLAFIKIECFASSETMGKMSYFLHYFLVASVEKACDGRMKCLAFRLLPRLKKLSRPGISCVRLGFSPEATNRPFA